MRLNVADVDIIIAFAFGNRIDHSGGQPGLTLPGPVNEALGAVALDLHRWSGALILAQWEIASVLETTSDVGSDVVNAIHPASGADGEVVYLSTRGVVEAVIASEVGDGGGASLGRAAVVAHADHIDRCLRISRESSIDAVSAAAIAIDGEQLMLPSFYDPQSAQPWTRTKANYLRHEEMMRSR